MTPIYKPEHCRPCAYWLPDGCDLDSRYTATRWPTAGPACRHFEREPGADDIEVEEDDVARDFGIANKIDAADVVIPEAKPVWFWWVTGEDG